jgi:type VI secretion system secreted protein Hcp
MALNSYLKMKGQTSGEVKGSVTQKGRENKIMVIQFSHEIVSPRDAASGLPTGKRMHKPIVIGKEIDKSTPILYHMLVNNENITEWKLEFWAPGAAGKEVQNYTIELKDASICNMTGYILDNKIPVNMAIPPLETVSFAYKKIIWTWMDGGITCEDDWEAPSA